MDTLAQTTPQPLIDIEAETAFISAVLVDRGIVANYVPLQLGGIAVDPLAQRFNGRGRVGRVDRAA